MMCYKEAVKMPPRPLVEWAVTPDQFQMFELNVRKRRRLWLWSVSTVEGEVLVEGAASTRPAAKYDAYRALFMLLLSASWKLRQRKPYKGRSVETIACSRVR
jgi:hypothetical protein